MDNFVRSTRRNGASQPEASSSSSGLPYHSAASKRLGKQPVPTSPLSSAPPSREGTPSSVASAAAAPSIPLSHVYPEETPEALNLGARFPIRWDQIWKGSTRLSKERLGYRVVDKQHLKGGSKRSGIYNYGADLLYQEPSGCYKRVWLCRLCHEQGKRDCSKYSDSTHHISTHMRRSHLISITTGLLPEPPKPSGPWEAAVAAAGANNAFSQSPWQEDELLRAYVDWIISHDLSLRQATSPETRGLLTWNRPQLLKALPSHHTTLAKYIEEGLEERKLEIKELLRTASSTIALSVDIWTSPNHLSFLGVVAHFVGMWPVLTIFMLTSSHQLPIHTQRSNLI